MTIRLLALERNSSLSQGAEKQTEWMEWMNDERGIPVPD
jgi:hypothetical protein